MSPRFYITTPIYYVNDRPHIGHTYSTAVADMVARYHRLLGEEVFFLTGTDEHAAKVADSAAEHAMSPIAWADRNAAEFKRTFEQLRFSHDDFIRTTEERHKARVRHYVEQLIASGDVYLGEYEGWYDAGQEEYVPEAKAKESDYLSPINGKPLVRKKEKNYFFRLSSYGDELQRLLEDGSVLDVGPVARRNEVLGRIRDGLNDVPISRTGAEGWGIPIPGDEEHTIYVWIDALFNYLTAVDTDERRHLWPADVHLIAKDILWFHAVIWPALLLALRKLEGNEWIGLPRLVYSHSFWIREGRKMSKSLGNFIDLEQIEEYVDLFGRDGLRLYLASNGPMGTTDGDFVLEKLIEVYNAELANTVGNCVNRVTNMTHRYFGGVLPEKGDRVPDTEEYDGTAKRCLERYRQAFDRLDLSGATSAALDLVKAVDSYIAKTLPFKRAKNPEELPMVGTILYNCAEALRIASVMLWPIIPERASELWRRFGHESYGEALEQGQGAFALWTEWGGLKAGTKIEQGKALFPRVDKEKILKEQEEQATPEASAAEAKPPKAESPELKKAEEPGKDKRISIDQFFDTELKVGTVKEAEPVPKSNKLLKLLVDIGEETPRSIVAGISKAYDAEELVGRQVVVVANLKPAKLMGVESQGMVLAASLDGKPVLVKPSVEVPEGTQVR